MIPLIALSLSCLLLIVVACSPNQLNTKATQENQLILATPSEPSTFNYPLNQSPYGVFSFLYEGLVSVNGVTGALEPALAESWEMSPDLQRIVFTLREGLKWSDGQPLTADDVIFTYRDIYLNPQIPTVYRDFLRIGNTNTFPSLQKLDKRRVEFNLPEPFTPFLRYTNRLVILPAHALRSSVESTDANGNPQFLATWGTDTEPNKIVGNGPYQMVSYSPSERVIFQRNPYYWRSDAQGNPQPYIERLVLQVIESTDNQLIRFRSGDLDSIQVTSEAFGLLKRDSKRGKYTIYNGGPEGGIRFVGFNLNQARNERGEPFVDPIKSRWFNTLAFRQAVAYALNRERIKNNIYRGLGEIQHSPLGVLSPYYLSPEEGLKVYSYDPQKAKQLLLDAGFNYNSQQQLLDGDGNQVKFTILVKSEDKSRVDLAVQIQQDLSQIGIQADLQVLSFNVVLKKLLRSRDWDCYVGSFGVPGADLEPFLLSLFWSSGGSFHQFNQGPQPGEPPILDWVASDWEREIDRLFLAGAKELDEGQRQVIYSQFQQIVAEQLPVFCLVTPLSLQAVRDRLQNIKYSALGGTFWNLYELQVRED
ncbi:MAG: ABC transporter substrate-binding protein [Symploca sp. SIO1B1]|nr:ABC transporter substrate-binding protein [Symploca sp. SIO1B1]